MGNLTSKLGRCVAVNKKLLNETEELEASLEAMNKTNADMLSKSKTLEKNLARCSKDLDEEVVRCSLLNEQFINETVKADAAISKNATCEKEPKTASGCCKRVDYLRNETAALDTKLAKEAAENKDLTELVAKACKLSCASTSCGKTPVECEPFCPTPNKGTWGTICDASFNHVAAGVVCRQMGYSNGYFLGNSVLQNPSSKSGILITDVKCSGGEKDIFSCDHVQGPAGCSHSMDVSVSCYNL